MWHKSLYRVHKNPPMGQTNLDNTLKPNSCQYSCQYALFSQPQLGLATFSVHTNKTLHTPYFSPLSVTWPTQFILDFDTSPAWEACTARLLVTTKFLSLPNSFHQQLRTCGQTSRNYKLVIRQLTDLSLSVISASTNYYLAMKTLAICPGMLRK
jgi:hypothetical protein